MAPSNPVKQLVDGVFTLMQMNDPHSKFEAEVTLPWTGYEYASMESYNVHKVAFKVLAIKEIKELVEKNVFPALKDLVEKT